MDLIEKEASCDCGSGVKAVSPQQIKSNVMIELSFPYCLLTGDLILHINYYVGPSYYGVVFPHHFEKD